MSSNSGRQANNWWAEGDMPVHADSQVAYLVDAHSTFITMCRRFLTARHYIYIAAWGMTPLMRLVRGLDQRAGPDDSREQEALVTELRDDGLQQEEISFWCSHDLTVQAVLGHMARKGVDVRVLIWASSEHFSHSDPEAAREQLLAAGVSCVLDDSARGILHHPIESLHQKLAVVDGAYAFVGGVDMLIELSGDYDRWDTHTHHYSSPLRSNAENRTPHNWHDAHAVIEGPAVGDVERNFRQRWNDVVLRHESSAEALVPEHLPPPPLASDGLVQIARTIPAFTYTFAPTQGIQGIAQLYANALSNAQQFVYIENQYFWTHAYYSPLGIGVRFHLEASESPDMERNVDELAAALRRGATAAIVLPDHPNVGRLFTDGGLAHLRERAAEAVAQGRLQAFCLAACSVVDGTTLYRPIYVHGKVTIIDDLWSTLGSANLNNRGMRDDTEANVATLNRELARGLRMLLWAEHLDLITDEEMLALAPFLGRLRRRTPVSEHVAKLLRSVEQAIGDPLIGLSLLTERAQENLERFKSKLPLVGHLLPYLTAEEARSQGLEVDEQHGWVETG